MNWDNSDECFKKWYGKYAIAKRAAGIANSNSPNSYSSFGLKLTPQNLCVKLPKLLKLIISRSYNKQQKKFATNGHNQELKETKIMTKIVSIHSFRGGTGKSNVTANLATLIARTGCRVGIVDTDIQSPGIHVPFGLDETKVKYTLNDYLWGRCHIQAAAYDVSSVLMTQQKRFANRGKIYLIPSSIKTGEISRILREGYDARLLNDGFRHLMQRLQ